MGEVSVGIHYSRMHDLVPVADFARSAEEMGFDSVWLPEGLVNEVPALDIMMAMSAFIHHSEKLTVGAGVVLLPLRSPSVLAKEVATLDHLSGGRVVLGIGVGGPPHSNPAAFAAAGVPLRERGARTDEALEIMIKLWSGEPVSHHGPFYQFDDVVMQPAPVQRPHPPLWAGGVSEGMLRRTARWCDGFYPVDVTPEHYQELWERIQRYGDEHRRDVSRLTKTIHMFFRIETSREAARDAAERAVNERRGFEVRLDDDGRFGFGTADDCVRAVEAFAAIGVRHVVFNPLTPPEQMAEQIEHLAERVIPRLK